MKYPSWLVVLVLLVAVGCGGEEATPPAFEDHHLGDAGIPPADAWLGAVAAPGAAPDAWPDRLAALGEDPGGVLTPAIAAAVEAFLTAHQSGTGRDPYPLWAGLPTPSGTLGGGVDVLAVNAAPSPSGAPAVDVVAVYVPVDPGGRRGTPLAALIGFADPADPFSVRSVHEVPLPPDADPG